MNRGASSWTTAAHLGVAFVAMGGWTIVANSTASMSRMLLAGALQGTLSAILTFGMKALVEETVRRASAQSARVVAPAFCALFSATVLMSLHRLAGTPEILATVAVPLAVSTGYAALYAHQLILRESAS